MQNIFARGFTNLAALNRQKTQARCLLPNYGPDIVNGSSHLFGELFSAEYMEVQMFYRLAGVVSAVGDNTVSVFDSCGRGYLRNFSNIYATTEELSHVISSTEEMCVFGITRM